MLGRKLPRQVVGIVALEDLDVLLLTPSDVNRDCQQLSLGLNSVAAGDGLFPVVLKLLLTLISTFLHLLYLMLYHLILLINVLLNERGLLV